MNHILDLFERMRSERRRHEEQLQLVFNYHLPDHSGITSRRMPGGKRTGHIFDSTGARSALDFANFLHGVLMPEGADWGKLRAMDERIQADRQASLFLDFASRKINGMLNNSNFYPQSFGSILDTVIGGGSLFIPRVRRSINGRAGGTLDGFFFRSIAVANYWLYVGEEGAVTGFALMDEEKASEIKQRFGDEAGRRIDSAINKEKKPDKIFQVLQMVLPTRLVEELGQTPPPGKFEWTSIHFIMGPTNGMMNLSTGHPEMIRKRGVRRFPGVSPRFTERTGETYPRGLGQWALPDVLEAQSLVKHTLNALGKDVDPPIRIGADAAIQLETFAGGTIVMDPDRFTQFETVQSGANYGAVYTRLDMLRRQIKETWMVDRLRLPEKLQRATTSEINERSQDNINSLGSIFGKMSREFPSKIIEWAFLTLMDMNALPPVPEILQGAEFEVVFDSPLAVNQRRQRLAPMDTFLSQLVLEVQATGDSSRLDIINFDEVDRARADGLAVQSRFLKSEDEVGEIRDQREQLRQAAIAAQATDVGSKALQRVPEAKEAVGL